MSPKQTMMCAQTLYEHGLITYMRTETPAYSTSFIEKINKQICLQYGKEYVGNPCSNVDTHEGIRVTDIKIDSVDFDSNTNKLYHFIYNHTFQSCMSTAFYIQTPYDISMPYDRIMRHISSYPKFKGWKILKDSDELESSGLDEKTIQILREIGHVRDDHFSSFEIGSQSYFNFQMALGITAVIGHVFPLFAGFKGGKGIATLLGMAIALNWQIALICIIAFVTIVWITKYISVGSMSAAILAALLSFFPYFYYNNVIANSFFCTIAILVVYTHRANIKRLKAGNENKFAFKK
jgi:hypothetical protein